MTKPDFVYVTYIKTTPDKLWAAITNPEFSRQYWTHGIRSDWKKGSKWEHFDENQRACTVGGEVLESIPPKRLVLSWAPSDDKADNSQVSFEIDAIEDMVRLTVVHGGFKADSKMASKVVLGWPRVLSSMKSLLETGKALDTWAGHSLDCAKAGATG